MVRKKMKLGTKIVIGLGVLAAGVGALLYYLSTRARGEELVVGKTYYFDYIPGATNQRNFIVGANFPYDTAHDIVRSIEGGTDPEANRYINFVGKWDPALGKVSPIYSYSAKGWSADYPISPGDMLIIGYVSSFSWTP